MQRHPAFWLPFIVPGSNDYRVHLNRALVRAYEDLDKVSREVEGLREKLGLPPLDNESEEVPSAKPSTQKT